MKCLDSFLESYITPILLSIGIVSLIIVLCWIVTASVEYGVNSKEMIESHCVNNTVVYRNTLSGSIATAGQTCSE